MIIVLVSIVIGALSAPLEKTIGQPRAYTVTPTPLTDEVFKNEQYSLAFPEIKFEISGAVYDINSNHAVTKESTMCTLKNTQVIASQEFKMSNTKSLLDSYYITKNYLYGVNDTMLYLFILDQDKLIFKLFESQIQLSPTFSGRSSDFAQVQSNLYVSDGKEMYLIQFEKDRLNTTKVDNFEDKNNLTFMKLKGDSSNHIMVLYSTSIVKYTLATPTSLTKQQVNLSMISNTTYLIDIQTANHKLFVLDMNSGIYVFDNEDPNSHFTLYELNYGINFRISVFGETIHVHFFYHQEIFVVELFIRQNGLVLNRFYQQLSQFRSIAYFDNKAFFLDEDTVMVIGHSINRNLILNMRAKQNKLLYQDHQAMRIEVVNSISTADSVVLVSINLGTIKIIRVNFTAPYLECDFTDVSLGTYNYLVEFNLTHCGSDSWQAWNQKMGEKDIYCNYRQEIQIDVKYPLERKLSVLATVIIVLMTIMTICIVTGYAARWKAIINKQMGKLRKQIQDYIAKQAPIN